MKPAPPAATPAPAKSTAQAPPAAQSPPETKKPTVVASTTPATPPKAAPAPAAAKPEAASGGDAKAQVTAAVAEWAKAWSAKDVQGYLGYYAPDFELPGGETRAAWEKQRAERIERPKSIEVEAKVLSAQVSGNEATVKIRQSYKSDTLKSHTTKTLKLEKSGDRWLIKQERAGG